MFEVTLSHQTPNGMRKHKANTLEAAKKLGDVEFSDVRLPHGRNGAGEYRILVQDATGHVVASRVLGGPWKDEPARGWQEFPKMLNLGGREIIVNSREEEEAALAPAAEAPVKKARAR